MTLATYDELVMATCDWLADMPQLASLVPSWIRLAEADFSRRLRVLDMETRATMTTVASTESTALPTGWRGFTRIKLTGGRKLEVATGQELDELPEASEGVPERYAIAGGYTWWWPVPDDAYAIPVTYWKAIPALGASQAANWLLDRAPDLYLFATLCQAEAYLQHDARLQVWLAAREKGIADLQTEDTRDRLSGSSINAYGGYSE